MIPFRKAALAAAAASAVALAAAPASQARTIVGTPGPDHLTAHSPGGDTLWGGGGQDVLTGGPGPDKIYGVRSNNKINGGAGDDYIEGGAGQDTVDGGSGNNTIFTTSGPDRIKAGDGNNYVDSGGAPDKVVLGNGNNVVVTGAGGGQYTVGNGNNTVYYGSGIAYITAGHGINNFYISATTGVRKLECGGNPQTMVHVNSATLGKYSLQIFKRKISHCPNIDTYDGDPRNVAVIAGLWESFHLVGGPGRDKLYGGHGGGTIDGGEGDNEIWADHHALTGLPRSANYTTTVTAGNGNNRVFGGRGTNFITLGNGSNFVRGGIHGNTISVGSGQNLIRLQGAESNNHVTINGRGDNIGSYIETFTSGNSHPTITCTNGAVATIVYGKAKPTTNCGTMYSALSKRGKELQVERTPGVPASDPVIEGQIQPGQDGIGVPRPNPSL